MVYDSGKVSVSVLHPNGELHNLEVPEDMPAADFHSAIVDEYAHPMFDQKQPTAEGALENSSDFKDTLNRAWMEAGIGQQHKEGAALIQNNGKSIPLPTNAGYDNKIPISQNTIATLHTHPNISSGKPSSADVSAAQKTGKTFYVLSKDGLYSIDPKGSVTRVYDSVADALDKKKLASTKK